MRNNHHVRAYASATERSSSGDNVMCIAMSSPP